MQSITATPVTATPINVTPVCDIEVAENVINGNVIDGNVVDGNVVNVDAENLIDALRMFRNLAQEQEPVFSAKELDDAFLLSSIVMSLIVTAFNCATIVLYLRKTECSIEQLFGKFSIIYFMMVIMIDNNLLLMLTLYSYYFLTDKRNMHSFLIGKSYYGKLFKNTHGVSYWILTIIGWIMFGRVQSQTCDNYTYQYFLTVLIFSSLSIIIKFN